MTKRILIMDDDCITREVLNEAIEPLGFIIENANDGNMGMRLHKQTPFDLIITDIIMPEKEGLETIHELKQISPHVIIIAISGGGLIGAQHYLSMAKKFGAQLTFSKPFNPLDVASAVNELLNT